MKKQEEKTGKTGGELLGHIGVCLYALAWLLIISFFRHCSYAELIRRGVTLLFALLLHSVIYEQQRTLGAFFFENEKKSRRYLLLWLLWVPLAAGMTVLPLTGWAYPALFVILALSSGTLSGILGGMALLLISVLLSGAPTGVFVLYLLAGVLAVTLYSDLEHAYTGSAVILGFGLLYLFLLGCMLLFYVTGAFRWESVLVPAANLFLSEALLLMITRQVNLRHLDVRASSYAGLGDPTAPLLEKLREEQPEQYRRAIHAMHFIQRLAAEVGADEMLCRTGGYYAWMPEVYPEAARREELYEEYGLPEELRDLLTTLEEKPYRTVEAFLISFSYALVDALLAVESGERTKRYGKLVELKLKEHYLSDNLMLLELSFADYARIETALLAEKKYLVMMERG